MPTMIRTVVFDPDEVRTIERAENLLDIGYPLASDPLVRRSEDAAARAVDDADPRRRVLRGLCTPYDLVSLPRLLLAREVLEVVLAQVVAESDVTYWLDLASDPHAANAAQMADVLAVERDRQQRSLLDAIELVDAALTHLTQGDDPTRVRDAYLAV